MTSLTLILTRWLALRHLRRHKLRTALAVFSIALGVATFVGMSTLNRSTIRSFEDTARKRAGNADLVGVGCSSPGLVEAGCGATYNVGY